MAVTQISKIQHRRGQKNSTSGIPQLSSAEFAWAVDSQELFIGNGSISEGAPAVGNTKILTEHDNLLELAGSYQFSSSDPSIYQSVARSLQSKLDETVSVIDFGAIADGSTDCTAAFHAAFAELYKNATYTFRKQLFIPNGNYLFLTDLLIPSFTILVGENPLETILDINNNNIIFTPSDGTLPEFVTSGNVPTNISISNLTISHTTGQTIISSSLSSELTKVTWQSGYELGDAGFISENANLVYNIPIVSSGGNIAISGTGISTTLLQVFNGTYISMLSGIAGILNSDIVFIERFTASIAGTSLKITANAQSSVAANIATEFTVTSLPSSLPGSITSTIQPEQSEFTDGSLSVPASIYWDNRLFGTRTHDARFKNCKFTRTTLAIECQQSQSFATSMAFSECEFTKCETAVYIGGVINQTNNWTFTACVFDKIASTALISTNGTGTTVINSKFIDCGNGTGTAQYPVSPVVTFGQSTNNMLIGCTSNRHQLSSIVSLTTLVSVPAFNNVGRAELVDENYSDIFLSDNPRPLSIFYSGSKIIILDYALTIGVSTRTGKLTMVVNADTVAMTDSYAYASENNVVTNFEFTSQLRDNDFDSVKETILLMYRNPISSGALGGLTYTITYRV